MDTRFFASNSDRNVLRDDEEWDPFFGPPIKRKRRQPGPAITDAAASSDHGPMESASHLDAARTADDHTMRGRTTTASRPSSGAAAAASAASASSSNMSFSLNHDGQGLLREDDDAKYRRKNSTASALLKKTWSESFFEWGSEWLPCLDSLLVGYNDPATTNKPASLKVLRSPEQMLRQRQIEPEIIADRKKLVALRKERGKYGNVDEENGDQTGEMLSLVEGQEDKRHLQDERPLMLNHPNAANDDDE